MKKIKSTKIIFQSNVTFIALIYAAFLILSNLTASKIASLGDLQFTAVIFLFPFTYIISDVLTEVYGFKITRKIIWGALLANLIFSLGTYIVIKIPASKHWHYQDSFENVFNTSIRILIASFLAYLCGEFLNSVILAKLKIYTKGKYFWLRAIASTVFGALSDTTVFMFVAFAFTLPISVIFEMILVEYIIKIIVEIIVLPFTMTIVNWLKNIDQIDYYDYDTSFNPFSLKT